MKSATTNDSGFRGSTVYAAFLISLGLEVVRWVGERSILPALTFPHLGFSGLQKLAASLGSQSGLSGFRAVGLQVMSSNRSFSLKLGLVAPLLLCFCGKRAKGEALLLH